MLGLTSAVLVLRGSVFLSHNDVSAVVITSLFSPVCAVASSSCFDFLALFYL